MIALWLAGSALAAQVQLRVDAPRLSEGQTIGVDVVIVDAQPRQVPDITAPAQLKLESQGGPMRETRIINFQRSDSTTFGYSMSALAPGDYTLGPVTVATDAGTLTSQAVSIHVDARSSGPLEDIAATIDSTVAYVGQVLVEKVRLQTDKNLVRAGGWRVSNAQGFTAEPTADPLQPEYSIVQDGTQLAVRELQYAFRATSPGKWTIPTAVYQAQYTVADDRRRRRGDFLDGIGVFGQIRTEVYTPKPIEVEVRPVPKEGMPTGASSLVGHFDVSASSTATTAKVGDTVMVEVTVAGDGVVEGLTLPPLQDASFRAYDDQPVTEAVVEDGTYHAKATFKRAIVPQVAGKLQIPAVELAWFDPGQGRWVKGHTDPIAIDVSGEAAHAAVETFNQGGTDRGVESLGEDILPVRTDASLGRPLSSRWAVALLAPGGLALLAQGLGALRRRAPKVQERAVGFDDLPIEPEARLHALERIFRARVAARLGVSPEALRRDDLASLGARAEEAEAVYRELERCRYGGAGDVSVDRVRALVEAL